MHLSLRRVYQISLVSEALAYCLVLSSLLAFAIAMHLKGSICPFIKSVSIQGFQGLDAVRSMIQVGTSWQKHWCLTLRAMVIGYGNMITVQQETSKSTTLGNSYGQWLWNSNCSTARNIEVYYFGQSCNYVSPRTTPYKPLLLLSIEITPWSHQATTNQPPNMKQTTQRTKSQTPSKTNFRNQIKRLPKIRPAI